MAGEMEEVLISENKAISPRRSRQEFNFELKGYSSGLKWVFIDYSNMWRAGLSWSLFFLLNIGVPVASHIVFSCPGCDSSHRRPYNLTVQLSLSAFAALSFISLSTFGRKYGLRRFLFLDKLCDESDVVRQGYSLQLHRSMKLLSAFVLPCFIADCAYQIWWFASKETKFPYPYDSNLFQILGCTLVIFSWLYRITICFLVCVLFSLACDLQILRLEDFAQVFEKESDVASILIEHLRIRRHLRIISHRFRVFILSTLGLVTISQFASLLVTTEQTSIINLFNAGELALCSITLVTGLLICLRSAAKITHKAQAVTSLAAKWHACATVDSFGELIGETPTSHIASAPAQCCVTAENWDTDSEGDGDDAFDNTKLVPVFSNTISYQKRQALVTYFEHNIAGITVYGFMLDRARLNALFAIQLSLTLWILNKTIAT